MSGCPFCAPVEGRIVESDDHCLFIDLEHAVLRGSGIIVPRAHRVTPFELTSDEIAATFALLRAARKRLDETLAPDGYNVGWNCGAVAGQEVPHVHLHLIPRFADEPYAGRGFRYWLKQDANRRP